MAGVSGAWHLTKRAHILTQMTEPYKNVPNSIGATVPDLILRILASPFLIIPLFILVGALIASVAFGFIEISWGQNGLKLSQGQHGVEISDVNLVGTWRGTAKDLTDSDHKLTAKYTYTMSMTFAQKGENIEMEGNYFISEDRSLPLRTISGKGSIHDDYLSLLYDIEAGQPPVARTHGSMVFQIQPSSQSAAGYYLGRSMANDGFVFGSLEIHR